MKHTSNRQMSTVFLKAAIVLIGAGTLAFLLWEPNVEGVNAHATFFEVYFDDPLLAYAYLASTPFFVALWQAFRLAGAAGRNDFFTQHSVNALRTIQYCATAMIPLIAIGVVWILSQESDDRPPIIAMGTLTSFASLIAATAANVFRQNVQYAVMLKSDNELTV